MLLLLFIFVIPNEVRDLKFAEGSKIRRNRQVCSVGTRSFILVRLSGSNSVVECDLAKVEVAGSNPVSRSRFSSPALARAFCFSLSC